jgi:hypothetical protein
MVTPIGTEVFSGFKIKYPEFEVITPQRKQSFSVRSMTVSEEETLKGSILTPITVAEHLSKVLWDCIVKKPDDIQTYEDFISKTTLRDRDTLVYGLYVATYKDTQNFSITCRDCGTENKVKINMEKGFSFMTWEKDEDCLNARIKIPFKVLEGCACYLKAPTIKDEIEMTKNTVNMSEKDATLATNIIMVDSIELAPSEENGQVEVIKDKMNIMKAFSQLPAYDRKLITREYEENFDKYRISVHATNKCRCGADQKLNIDVTRQFFLALY